MPVIQVVLGSTREGRFGARVADWVVAGLSRDDLKVELLDLRDYPLPFFDAPAPARNPRQYPSPEVERLGRKLDEADGFVLVSPEYNHGYSAVLKNAMDSTFVEWRHKPVAFVGWGNVGGARAVEQLRLVAVEFEMAPLRHAVHILPDVLIPAIQAPEPFDPSVFAPLEPRLELLRADLRWWTDALAAARAATPTDHP